MYNDALYEEIISILNRINSLGVNYIYSANDKNNEDKDGFRYVVKLFGRPSKFNFDISFECKNKTKVLSNLGAFHKLFEEIL